MGRQATVKDEELVLMLATLLHDAFGGPVTCSAVDVARVGWVAGVDAERERIAKEAESWAGCATLDRTGVERKTLLMFAEAIRGEK